MTLDELEALERAATLRPWRTKFDAACGHVVTTDQEWVCIVGDEEGARELAAFVAAARNALPALLRLARCVAEERDAAQATDKVITDSEYLGAQARYRRAVLATAAALEALP